MCSGVPRARIGQNRGARRRRQKRIGEQIARRFDAHAGRARVVSLTSVRPLGTAAPGPDNAEQPEKDTREGDMRFMRERPFKHGVSDDNRQIHVTLKLERRKAAAGLPLTMEISELHGGPEIASDFRRRKQARQWPRLGGGGGDPARRIMQGFVRRLGEPDEKGRPLAQGAGCDPSRTWIGNLPTSCSD